MATPHVHAELIKQWADDPSQPVWYWSRTRSAWLLSDEEFHFKFNFHYALGDKPTQPPRKMCELAGVKFPLPETVAPTHGTLFWSAETREEQASISCRWRGDADNQSWLSGGFVHLTQAAAEAHSSALIAATKAAMEAAK